MRCHVETFLERSSIVPFKVVSKKLLRDLLLQGGGVYIEGTSTVKFEGCGIYSNSAANVGSTYLNRFPEFSPIAPLQEVSLN